MISRYENQSTLKRKVLLINSSLMCYDHKVWSQDSEREKYAIDLLKVQPDKAVQLTTVQQTPPNT